MTATQAPTYYRTTYGSHAHRSEYCANARRAIGSGYPTIIPADEVASWAPCEHCCPTDEVQAAARAAQEKQDAMCSNSGVTHPRRLNSRCKDCGKEGKVNRGTGRLRAHQPQS